MLGWCSRALDLVIAIGAGEGAGIVLIGHTAGAGPLMKRAVRRENRAERVT